MTPIETNLARYLRQRTISKMASKRRSRLGKTILKSLGKSKVYLGRHYRVLLVTSTHKRLSPECLELQGVDPQIIKGATLHTRYQSLRISKVRCA